MHDLTIRYSGQVDEADPAYPWGKARNQIDEGDGIGTPWERDLANDFIGSLHSVFYRFGKTPGISAETATTGELGKILERVALQSARASCQYSGEISGPVPQAAAYDELVGGFIYMPVALSGSPKLRFVDGLAAVELDGTTGAGTMKLAQIGSYSLMGHSSSSPSTNRLYTKNEIEGSWSSVTGLASGTNAPLVFANPTANVFYVFDGTAVYQHTPGVGLATAGTAPFVPTHIAISETAGMVIIQSGTANRARSLDGGATWTSSNFGGGALMQGIVWLEKTAQFVCFLKYSSGSIRHRRQTSFDGLDWNDVQASRLVPFIADNSGSDTIRSVVAINGLLLVCGISNDSNGNLKLYSSTNTGATWQPIRELPTGGPGDVITAITPGRYGFIVSTAYSSYRFGT